MPMGVPRKRWWRGLGARRLGVCAALALVLALPARPYTAEGEEVKVRCDCDLSLWVFEGEVVFHDVIVTLDRSGSGAITVEI